MPNEEHTEWERWEQVVASPPGQSRPKPKQVADTKASVRIALALENIANRVGQIRRRLDEDPVHPIEPLS